MRHVRQSPAKIDGLKVSSKKQKEQELQTPEGAWLTLEKPYIELPKKTINFDSHKLITGFSCEGFFMGYKFSTSKQLIPVFKVDGTNLALFYCFDLALRLAAVKAGDYVRLTLVEKDGSMKKWRIELKQP